MQMVTSWSAAIFTASWSTGTQLAMPSASLMPLRSPAMVMTRFQPNWAAAAIFSRNCLRNSSCLALLFKPSLMLPAPGTMVAASPCSFRTGQSPFPTKSTPTMPSALSVRQNSSVGILPNVPRVQDCLMRPLSLGASACPEATIGESAAAVAAAPNRRNESRRLMIPLAAGCMVNTFRYLMLSQHTRKVRNPSTASWFELIRLCRLVRVLQTDNVNAEHVVFPHPREGAEVLRLCVSALSIPVRMKNIALLGRHGINCRLNSHD